jgi:hypothetical protein
MFGSSEFYDGTSLHKYKTVCGMDDETYDMTHLCVEHEGTNIDALVKFVRAVISKSKVNFMSNDEVREALCIMHCARDLELLSRLQGGGTRAFSIIIRATEMCELELFFDMIRGGLCNLKGAKEVILVVEATTYASHVHDMSEEKYAFLHLRPHVNKCNLRGYGSDDRVSDEDRSAYIFRFEEAELQALHKTWETEHVAACMVQQLASRAAVGVARQGPQARTTAANPPAATAAQPTPPAPVSMAATAVAAAASATMLQVDVSKRVVQTADAGCTAAVVLMEKKLASRAAVGVAADSTTAEQEEEQEE